MSCAVCGSGCEVVWYHFPTRLPPHNQPFARALYFSDPFMGGDDVDFCGVQCSLEWTTRRPTPQPTEK